MYGQLCGLRISYILVGEFYSLEKCQASKRDLTYFGEFYSLEECQALEIRILD
jgi:hypothetical protein